MRTAHIPLSAWPVGDGFVHNTCLPFLITLGEGTERLNNFPTSHSTARTLT